MSLLRSDGGDYVLPGATEYQPLHRDQGDFLADQSGRLDFRDLPCSRITVNYPIEVVQGSPVGHTRSNGCTRQIVGTQRSREPIPTLEEECAAPTRTSPCALALLDSPVPAVCDQARVDAAGCHRSLPRRLRADTRLPSLAWRHAEPLTRRAGHPLRCRLRAVVQRRRPPRPAEQL